MGGNERKRKTNWLDWLVLVCSLVLFASIPIVGEVMLPAFDFTTLAAVAGGLSEVAGLVAALSLAGLAIAGGTGRARQILERHSTVFAVFFTGGYTLVVLLALSLTFAPTMSSTPSVLRILIYATASALAVTTLLTALVLFGLFRASSKREELPPPSGPIGPPMH